MQQLTTNTLLHGGTYRIEKVLGQGSFGITYLGVHTSLDRKVAIKEFFMKELNSRGDDGSITGMTEGSLSQNYAQKFKKEALNLARLEHPNIVRVTDSFDENGTYYYVMDYIEGENLNDYVKRSSISEKEAISIIYDVCDALIYMHEEKHMLHLDLKPGNIMRRKSDGHIFLIDFGLSKHYSNDGQPETSTTIGLGTAGYAPIEQGNRAINGEFRPTIDVYALGATLYKLLTRETPPTASDLVSDDELLASSMRTKGVSEALISIVEKAMMPNVKKRVQNIRDFKSLLGSISSSATSSNQSTFSDISEETVIISSKPQINTQANTQTESKSSTSKEDVSPLTHSEKKNSTIKYIVAAVLVCVIGIGAYFVLTPSNKEKYIEAVNLQNGYGIEKNEERAFEIFQELSNKGYGPATFEVMQALRFGTGVTVDSVLAESYKTKVVEQLQNDADKDDMYAEYCLGRCYEDGYCVSQSDDTAKAWFEKSAIQGYAAAQEKYGLTFFFEAENSMSDSMAIDESIGQKAFEYLKKSADQNYPEGQYFLAQCYAEGIGTSVDSTQWMNLIKVAADNNETNALSELGTCYINGQHLQKNDKKGFECLKKAVDLGHPFAASDLAYCYYAGIGTTKNIDEAIKVIMPLATDFNDDSAQYALYNMYVAKNNLSEAIKWCTKSAEQNNPYAQYELAWRYQQGAGVKTNLNVAEKWYKKAIANGYQE